MNLCPPIRLPSQEDLRDHPRHVARLRRWRNGRNPQIQEYELPRYRTASLEQINAHLGLFSTEGQDPEVALGKAAQIDCETLMGAIRVLYTDPRERIVLDPLLQQIEAES